MKAEELLTEGDLSGALEELQSAVRKKPAEARLRIFLFQLLAVMGDWKRAVAQLKVCAELDPSATVMAQTYREAIICEVYREKVFAGEKRPLVFGEPPEWLALLIEALQPLAVGRAEQAASLRARAFEMAPAVPGTLNGTPFEWVADADMRLGPALELIMNGRYFWAPFGTIRRLAIEAPNDLRDQVWIPAQVQWVNGGETVALIPTRYPGTAASGDNAVRLSRATRWEDAGLETFVGIGQRLIATDSGDTALMDVREIVLGEAPEMAAVAGAEGADG